MSPNHSSLFDVVGAGYVAERHDDDHHRHLSRLEHGAIGAATAWLAFYAIAVVIVVAGNFHKTFGFVFASN